MTTTPILRYLPFPGFWGDRVKITQPRSEGYPTGELRVEGLTEDNLRALADWMIGLPPELYDAVKVPHRIIEQYLALEAKV